MNNYYRPIAFISAFFLLSLVIGCKQPAPKPAAPAVDVRAVARSIILCKTTEAELRHQMGEPTRDGIIHNAHIVSWITQMDAPSRYLAVMLNDHGVVVDLYWDIPTEIPWVPANQCSDK